MLQLAVGIRKFAHGDFEATFICCRRRVDSLLELSDEVLIFGGHK